MATFEYIAKSTSGEEVGGVMRGDSEQAVVRTLNERSLFPVRIEEQVEQVQRGWRGQIRQRDVGVMFGQLADLLCAGVPMLRALETLVRAGIGGRLVQVVLKVRNDVSGGMALADAMEQHGEVFKPVHAGMVRAGERAGFLEEVLTNLSQFIERQDELRSRVRGALIYPMVLVVIGAALTFVGLVFLVPKFKEFIPLEARPLPTAVLFGLSDLVVERQWLLLILLVLGVLGVRFLLKSRFGQAWWDRWKLKIPFVGRIIRMVSITRFCRILGMMLANGVPILQALAISKDAAGSQILSDAIDEATESVRAGEPLAQPLKASEFFPAEIIEMIAVGEESNQLEKVLVQVAETFDRRTGRQVDQAVRLVEPAILVLMAVGIGFVLVGLLYPLFTLGKALR